MRITQLEKTTENIFENYESEDVYFIRLTEFRKRDGKGLMRRFDTRKLRDTKLTDIERYLTDNTVALIKVELNDA